MAGAWVRALGTHAEWRWPEWSGSPACEDPGLGRGRGRGRGRGHGRGRFSPPVAPSAKFSFQSSNVPVSGAGRPENIAPVTGFHWTVPCRDSLWPGKSHTVSVQNQTHCTYVAWADRFISFPFVSWSSATLVSLHNSLTRLTSLPTFGGSRHV